MTARKWTRRVVAVATLAGATAFGVIAVVPGATPSQTACDKIGAVTSGHPGQGYDVPFLGICGGPSVCGATPA